MLSGATTTAASIVSRGSTRRAEIEALKQVGAEQTDASKTDDDKAER